ncbi:MAG: glutathione S-transferase family protein [Pseudomonadota bacterium]
MKFTLYHYPATRSARVRWALYETVGDDFETRRVDLYAGEQYGADHLARNPNHNVPVLEIEWDDGARTTMLESTAMVSFLADAFPDKGLAPAPLSKERADYQQMLQFAGTTMDMMLWQIRIHEHVLPADECDRRTVERYRAKFETEVEPQLAARLERHPFACGDDFTAADCVLGHSVSWARGYGLCQDKVFRRYISTLAQRPAFRKAFDDVGEFKPEPPTREERSMFNG